MKHGALILSLLVIVLFAGCKEAVVGKDVAEKVTAGAAVAEEANWLIDFDAAKKLAVAKDLPILINFSGSDWCSWCVKLGNEVFSQDEFQEYAKDNIVLFEADFPRGKKIPEALSKQNQELMQRYGVRGFPTVLVLDTTGKLIGKTGYQPGGPAKYIEHIKEILARKK